MYYLVAQEINLPAWSAKFSQSINVTWKLSIQGLFLDFNLLTVPSKFVMSCSAFCNFSLYSWICLLASPKKYRVHDDQIFAFYIITLTLQKKNSYADIMFVCIVMYGIRNF